MFTKEEMDKKIKEDFTITAYYMFITCEKEIVGLDVPIDNILAEMQKQGDETVWYPFVCSNVNKLSLDYMKTRAKQIGEERNIKVKLIKFTNREEVEDIT